MGFKRKHKEKIIRSVKEKILHEIVFIIFIIYALTLLYPFIFVLLNSVKDMTVREWAKFGENRPFSFPTSFTLSAYSQALEKINISEMYFNSITLAVGQTFTSMALTCMAAYVLAKYRFKGSNFLYTFIIVCSVVPTFGAEAATFRLMDKLGLFNNYFGMMLLCGGFGGTFLYVHSFFKGVPWTFAESAKIDGASDFRIFLQIVLPLAKNGIMVFTIMKFIGYWNEYWIPYLYYREHPTIAVGLYQITDLAGQLSEGGVDFNVLFAGTVLCILPILVAYGFLSDKLMGNLTAGGIKG